MREGKPARRTGRVKSEDGVPRGKHIILLFFFFLLFGLTQKAAKNSRLPYAATHVPASARTAIRLTHVRASGAKLFIVH
jgi:hypothetical protein